MLACMNVSIKNFNVAMEVKNSGIEFEIRSTTDVHIGDLVITKTSLIWCEGKTQRANGKKISLDEFRTLMNARP